MKLNDSSLLTQHSVIDVCWMDADDGRILDVSAPGDGSLIATVSRTSTKEAARRACKVSRVAEALASAMAGVSKTMIADEASPFSGAKQSRLGREGSKYGIDGYLEIMYINMVI